MLPDREKQILSNYKRAFPLMTEEEKKKLLISSETLALLSDVREEKVLACPKDKIPHTSG